MASLLQRSMSVLNNLCLWILATCNFQVILSLDKGLITGDLSGEYDCFAPNLPLSRTLTTQSPFEMTSFPYPPIQIDVTQQYAQKVVSGLFAFGYTT